MRRQFVVWASAVLLAAGLVVSGSEAAGEWECVKVMPAAEANQAAAADEQFVYAITNEVVAKYDRETGERVAVSQGEAHHLNSGFLLDGRLYCAHSNYPEVPERSEIKVLALDTMELATFKDFGSYGGSLTWCVYRDGRWWCNFAYYGEKNADTYLVAFDENWQEAGRWTYPEEVIREMGRYSVSGGIWPGDELLVTGHTEPVLYTVRLPESGTVLEYVGKQFAPFTGQGIASDPATGGLVGINRPKKELVFAAKAGSGRPRLRVLSYNIHHGEGVDGTLDLARIARVILNERPDVVALQEVDKGTGRTDSVDQPEELARLTGMQVVFGGNIPLQGGEYGNAVLSRFPIARHQNHLLPCFDGGEQRGVLEVEIAHPELDVPLILFATHLDFRPEDGERIASAQAINELAAQYPDLLALLAGDLNAMPDSAVLREFGKIWTPSNESPLPTIPVGKPARQIDYVFYRPSDRWVPIETRVLDEAVASDHRAILAVFELR